MIVQRLNFDLRWSWKSIDFLLNIESASLERSFGKVVLVLAVENLELVELLLGLAQKDLSETLWLDLAITSFTASDGLVCSVFLAVEGDLVILVPVFVAVFAKLKIP